MLALYHFGPVANSLTPLLCLFEKGLDFDDRFLNARLWAHHTPEFLEINPQGMVPVLVHESRAVTESTVINEYLEDVFQQVPLRPADPYERAQMRIWTKWVDEYFCWCVSTIGWHRVIGPMARALNDAEFEEKVKRIPVPEQQVKWRTARAGFPQDVLDEEFRKVRVSVARLEETLSKQDYLVDGEFTLADICNFAIAVSFERGGYEDIVNETATPGLLAWMRRIHERPACVRMFAETRAAMEAQGRQDPALAAR